MPSNLPADDMDIEDFDRFKKKYFEGAVISDEALLELERLYGIRDISLRMIACDDMHGHSQRCVRYENVHTGVVDNLMSEIRMYQRILDNIKDVVQQNDPRDD
ncbi:hypothetical protein CMI45_02030 [Candidatus Pacearchaeota archaeon]|nr:hypothetical protein [Candidatus Pacearchaeota archaeon]|tara:strand:- start:3466 stop:3774 length:309 start_codon:yes stop_codon:yes gene_type:complete